MDSLELAELLKDRQRTSSSGGILKAEAVVCFAQILLDHEVQRLRDVVELLNDLDRRESVEAALSAVPRHGSGVRTSYLWMLLGDDSYAKADRVVMSWLANVLGRPVAVEEAATLLRAAAPGSGRTTRSGLVPAFALVRGRFTRVWQVKDSNLRSFRDGFTCSRSQLSDLHVCGRASNFRTRSARPRGHSRHLADILGARSRDTDQPAASPAVSRAASVSTFHQEPRLGRHRRIFLDPLG